MLMNESTTHCDNYIDDETQPLCLRRFLRYHRWPATYQVRAVRLGVKEPALFADFIYWKEGSRNKKRRVRVVMASRLGDVGITTKLDEYQYEQRVNVDQLSNFSDKQ